MYNIDWTRRRMFRKGAGAIPKRWLRLWDPVSPPCPCIRSSDGVWMSKIRAPIRDRRHAWRHRPLRPGLCPVYGLGPLLIFAVRLAPGGFAYVVDIAEFDTTLALSIGPRRVTWAANPPNVACAPAMSRSRRKRRAIENPRSGR